MNDEQLQRIKALMARHAAPFEVLQNFVREFQRKTGEPLAALQRAALAVRANMIGRP